MFGVIKLTALLATLVSPSQEHAIGNPTCQLKFLKSLNETARLKQECGCVTFSDCCQYKTVAGLAPNDRHGNFQQPKTGVYTITDPCTASTRSVFTEVGRSDARCDMDSGNGGWLVIQRRVAGGTEDFNREWSDYEEGFGDLEGEFWYGLKNIHCLTNRESVELRLDLEDKSGNMVTRTYQEFRVEGPENKYRLHIGGGYTPAGARDFMASHNNRYFSTKNRDNDLHRINCARERKGGWWWERCGHTNPNGLHSSSNIAHRPSVYTGSQWVYYPNYI